MADWGPVLIGVVLFILLQPGLLFQIPGNNRTLEFGSMKTNGKAIAVHTLIFFTLYAILILAVHVHIYTGWSHLLQIPLFLTEVEICFFVILFFKRKYQNYIFFACSFSNAYPNGLFPFCVLDLGSLLTILASQNLLKSKAVVSCSRV